MSVQIRQDKNMIIMTKQGTMITTISITDADGHPYEPAPTDKLRFALKKDYNDRKVLIYKEIPIDTMTLRIESEDTKSLEQPQTYVYDIQLTYGDGIVDTIISGKLKLMEQVE